MFLLSMIQVPFWALGLAVILIGVGFGLNALRPASVRRRNKKRDVLTALEVARRNVEHLWDALKAHHNNEDNYGQLKKLGCFDHAERLYKDAYHEYKRLVFAVIPTLERQAEDDPYAVEAKMDEECSQETLLSFQNKYADLLEGKKPLSATA